MTAILIQSILFLIATCYVLYVLLELRTVILAGKAEKLQLTELETADLPLSPEECPPVSVLLPIYNENEVALRLIDAVSNLDYQADKLEILVLDDSTDSTTGLLHAKVAAYASEGVSIRLLRRDSRAGYKAGNLIHGMNEATGEFLAIFDADCLPPRDFLRKTMPCFDDPKVGFLQTGIRYANRGASFLTMFQAMESGHRQFVAVGLHNVGLMASLSSNSCIWRKSCIEDAGGISAETITEDVDLGYRAQLRAWKYGFLRNVTSVTELPSTISAFRVQRERWARGLVQNAARHVRAMFSVPMPADRRIHALSLLFSSLLLASFYLLILLALPLALVTESLGTLFNINCAIFLLATAIWAGSNFKGGRRGTRINAREPITKTASRTLAYVVMFLPISLYYFCAAVRVLAGFKGGFHRTPKGKNALWEKRPPINTILAALEIFTLSYALVTLICAFIMGNYWICLFSFLVCSGFSVTIFLSWRERRAKRTTMEHVLITGATGAIGEALAMEYARPGRTLTLHGRRMDKLEQVAEQCRAKGASTHIRSLDLRDRKELRSWLEELCGESIPDLVIVNAGLLANAGSKNEGERPEEAEAMVEVNLLAAMAIMDGVLPWMRKRGSGQIALMSSLAGYFGLPLTPTYCATKAALKTYGESQRGQFAPEGIRINVIMPGCVASPMLEALPGPRPFIWTPERAAQTIRKGLERDKARISFPFPLNAGLWILSALPASLSIAIARWFIRADHTRAVNASRVECSELNPVRSMAPDPGQRFEKNDI